MGWVLSVSGCRFIDSGGYSVRRIAICEGGFDFLEAYLLLVVLAVELEPGFDDFALGIEFNAQVLDAQDRQGCLYGSW